jgi:hypothetical protein
MGASLDRGELQGHAAFAAAAFNRAWELIDLAERSPSETAEMVDAAHASAWHWRYREDRSPKSDAVAAWQLSRVYALAGDAQSAAAHGQRSLDLAHEHSLGPFYVGYAHEALARAALAAGDSSAAASHAAAAAEHASQVEDDEERNILELDLRSLTSLGEVAGWVNAPMDLATDSSGLRDQGPVDVGSLGGTDT